MGAINQQIISALRTVKFYQEMTDKEAERSHEMWLAKLDNSDVMVNKEHMVVVVALQSDGTYAPQLANIDYVYDYCISVTQDFVAEVAPELIKELKRRGFASTQIKKPKAAYATDKE
jgi:hypothetical protein